MTIVGENHVSFGDKYQQYLEWFHQRLPGFPPERQEEFDSLHEAMNSVWPGAAMPCMTDGEDKADPPFHIGRIVRTKGTLVKNGVRVSEECFAYRGREEMRRAGEVIVCERYKPHPHANRQGWYRVDREFVMPIAGTTSKLIGDAVDGVRRVWHMQTAGVALRTVLDHMYKPPAFTTPVLAECEWPIGKPREGFEEWLEAATKEFVSGRPIQGKPPQHIYFVYKCGWD